MEEKTKVFKLPSTLTVSLLWIVLGVILLIYPGQSLDLICRILGVIALAFGVIQIIIGFTGGGGSKTFAVAVGLILAVIGLVIVINPDLLVSLLPTVIGIMLIIHGVASLINSFRLIGSKDKYWWVGLLLSILSIGMGALLFFKAREAAESVARIGGVFLIYSGISHLWLLIRLNKAVKQRKQEAEAIDVDATVTDK